VGVRADQAGMAAVVSWLVRRRLEPGDPSFPPAPELPGVLKADRWASDLPRAGRARGSECGSHPAASAQARSAERARSNQKASRVPPTRGPRRGTPGRARHSPRVTRTGRKRADDPRRRRWAHGRRPRRCTRTSVGRAPHQRVRRAGAEPYSGSQISRAPWPPASPPRTWPTSSASPAAWTCRRPASSEDGSPPGSTRTRTRPCRARSRRSPPTCSDSANSPGPNGGAPRTADSDSLINLRDASVGA
jgi:hypothetical protein